MPLNVSSTCAHRQEAKIVLYNLWYHHTYRWPSGAQINYTNMCVCVCVLSVSGPRRVESERKHI